MISIRKDSSHNIHTKKNISHLSSHILKILVGSSSTHNFIYDIVRQAQIGLDKNHYGNPDWTRLVS